MRRLRRIVARGALVVSVLAVAGLLVVHTPWVRSRVLSWAIRELAARFHLTLTATNLRYNLFSGSVSIDDVRLAASARESQPFFSARQVRVSVPLAAYAGKLAFERIEVDDGHVDVVRAADGTSNLPGGGPAGRPPDQPRNLDVRGLVVGTLDFTLDDQQHDVAIAARGVSATLARGGPLDGISGPFAVKGGVTVRVRERTVRLAPIDSVLGFDGSSVGLKDLPLQTREADLLAGGRVTRVLDAPRLDLTLGGRVKLEPAVEWVSSPVPVAGNAEIAGTMTGVPSAFVLALDVNGRGLTIGRATGIAVTGPIRVTPDGLTSDGVQLTPPGGGGVRAALDVPFGGTADTHIKAAWTDLDARAAVALANLDSPAVGAALTGTLEFTPGTDLALVFSTRSVPVNTAGLTPVGGTASGGIKNGYWALSHNVSLPGLSSDGQLSGAFNRDAPGRSALVGASNVIVSDIGAATRALAPLGVSVPEFVRQLEGTVKAPVKLSGTFENPRLVASVEADQLQVPSLGKLDVGADIDITPRMVTISPLFASRFSTAANGQVTIDLETKALGGAVRVLTANATDLQAALPPEWQMEGHLNAVGAIGGTTSDPFVDVTAEGSKIMWAGQAFDALSARAHITTDDLRVDALQLRQGNGHIETSGRYTFDTRGYTALVDAKALSWRGALVGDTESQVTLSAHFEGAGTIDRPEGEASADFTLSGGAAGDLVGEGRVEARLDGQDAHIRATVPSLGALVTGTVGLAAPLPYRFAGLLNRVDLAKLVPLTGITGDVVRGQSSISVAINGQLADSPANGGSTGPEVFANLQALNADVAGVPVNLLAPARIQWRADELTVTGLEAAIGKGSARASGTWASRSGTTFDAAYRGELGDVLRVARAFNLPADLDGTGTVQATIRSTGDAGSATANLVIDKGRIVRGDSMAVNDLQVQASLVNKALSVTQLAGTVTAEQVTGSFAGTAQATVQSFDLQGLDGELTFDRAAFEVARLPVEQQQPTRITFKNGVIGAANIAWSVAGSPLAVSGGITTGDTTAFDLDVKGSTDLRVVTAVVPSVGFDGTADLDVHIGGTPGAPDLDGRINLKDAEVVLPNPRAIIGDLNGPILLKGSHITIPTMRGSANGGDMTVEGSLDLVDGGFTGAINAQASGVAVEFPRGLRSEAAFILTFSPGPGTPRLTGDVRIERASYTETISLAGLARNRVVAPRPVGATGGPTFADRIALNVSLSTVEDMVVDNNYGRFETGANVRLVGTVATPGLTGRVTLREGGEVYLAGRTFRINRGDISFAELNRIAPEFNIEAQARVGQDDLTMRLTGPIEKPEFELSSSSRDKSAEELASDLLGGENTGQSALTLLTSDLLGVTGRRLGLSTLRIDRVDTFDTDFREDPTLVSTDEDPATRLTVGKRLRDNVEVTVSQNLKENGETTFIVSYFILPNFEIRAISKDDAELGIGVRHQVTFGGPDRDQTRQRAPQPTVSAITFAGDPAPLQPTALRVDLRLEEGEPFNFYDWQRDIDRMREQYIEQGHFEARVRGRREESQDRTSMAIEYRLEPGPRTEIVVQGLELPAAERRQLEEAWTRAVFDRFLRDDLENHIRRHLVMQGDVEGTVESRLTNDAGVKRMTLLVDQGTRASHREIRFAGNQTVASSQLANAITEAGLDVEAWLDPQQLVPVLQAHYREHGFLTARVTPGAPQVEAGRGVLPVTIDEGARASITDITWVGVNPSRLEDLRATANLPVPMLYDNRRLAEAVARVERHYRARGFNGSTVETSSKPDATNTAIALTMTVEEGPQQILKEVVTSGATRTKDGVVNRALSLPVGQPVNLEEWARARKRLYDTNVFQQVDVVAEPIGDPAGGIQPVRARVTVVEYPPWRLRYGLQLEQEREAIDESSVADALGVVAEIRNQNLFGRAYTGGMFVRYERLAQDASAFASNASFFGLPIRSSVFGFFQRDNFRDPGATTIAAITDRIGASFEQRIRQRRLQFTYAYRYETNHTFDPDPPPNDVFPLDLRANLARLSGAVIWDRRSDLLSARQGTFSSISLEYSAPNLGSDVRYTKLLAQQHVFTSVGDHIVLASRAQGGKAWHPENLLPIDRFKAGGATTVRGYPEDSLGSYDVFGLPRGGGQLVILNQEVRFPVYRWFGGVGFIDAGNIFDQAYPFSWSELKYGYGVGLRLSSPVGLFRLDLGIPGSTIAGLPSLRANSWSSKQVYFGIGHIF